MAQPVGCDRQVFQPVVPARLRQFTPAVAAAGQVELQHRKTGVGQGLRLQCEHAPALVQLFCKGRSQQYGPAHGSVNRGLVHAKARPGVDRSMLDRQEKRFDHARLRGCLRRRKGQGRTASGGSTLGDKVDQRAHRGKSVAADIVVIHDHYRDCWRHVQAKDDATPEGKHGARVMIRSHAYQALRESGMTDDEAKVMANGIVEMHEDAIVTHDLPVQLADAQQQPKDVTDAELFDV